MKDTVELIFLLDRSGSMQGMELDTIGGFNSFLEKQKNKKGNKTIVSLVLFNSRTEVIYNRVPINDVKPLTQKNYIVGGSTALIDSISGSINHVLKVHHLLGKENKPNKVMFVITTDGYENSSHRYSNRDLKNMVLKKEEEGWEFIFLGANIDSYHAVHRYGFRHERVSNFRNDSKGIKRLYESLHEAVDDLRSNREIRNEWKERVENDFKTRKGK